MHKEPASLLLFRYVTNKLMLKVDSLIIIGHKLNIHICLNKIANGIPVEVIQ